MTAPLQLEPTHHTDVVAEPIIADEQLFEQKEVAGLSQMQIVRRRFFRHKGAMVSLVVLAFIVLTSVTSIGAGPIPGWWKWEHTDVVPTVAGRRTDDVAAADAGSVAPASSSATIRSASTTRSARTCSR